MKTLHLLKKRDDRLAEDAIRAELAAGDQGQGVTVLLLQDAVLGSPDLPVSVFVSGQDLRARGAVRPCETVDYGQICRMILEHDRVVVW